MTVQLVDLSPDAGALRSAVHGASNDLCDLSIKAGGLAGLLDLIAGNTDHLTEQQCLAIGALADMAKEIESEITAIVDRLGEAKTGDNASTS